jgi:hypothetical protein
MPSSVIRCRRLPICSEHSIPSSLKWSKSHARRAALLGLEPLHRANVGPRPASQEAEPRKRLRPVFKAFVLTNASGYGLASSEPVGSPASVRVANGVYAFGLKT